MQHAAKPLLRRRELQQCAGPKEGALGLDDLHIRYVSLLGEELAQARFVHVLWDVFYAQPRRLERKHVGRTGAVFRVHGENVLLLSACQPGACVRGGRRREAVEVRVQLAYDAYGYGYRAL